MIRPSAKSFVEASEATGSERSFVLTLAAFFLIVLLLVLAAFGVLLEILSGVTTYPLFLATVVAIGLGAAELGRRWLRSRGLVIAGFAFAAVILILRFVALNPAKPFRTFYRGLEPGMTESMVLERLARSFPAGGRFAIPSISHSPSGTLILTLDPHQADYDSEFIAIHFEEGKVERFSYLMD